MIMTMEGFIERWGCRQEIISTSGNKNQRADLDALITITKTAGIAEGLRMAAEIIRDQPWKIYDDRTNVYKLIIAKAKEVEEGQIES